MSKTITNLATRQNGHPEPQILSSGYAAILRPVSLALIQEAVRSVKEPEMIYEEVPSLENPEKMVKHPNPDHPEYKQRVERYEQDQVEATLDVLTMFGVDLVDGIPDPESDTWLARLKLAEKKGLVDLSLYDLNAPIELEFVFKRYKAVTKIDLEKLQQVSGITAQAYEAARDTFPGDPEWNADSPVPAQE